MMSSAPAADAKKTVSQRMGKNGETINPDFRFNWCTKVMAMKVMAINKEFVANKTMKPEVYTTTTCDKNQLKNRYDDIFCTDSTRIVLKDRRENDDYIHGNWMTMPDGRRFICTQGPLPTTMGDFWHMVVTEESSVIVMLVDEDKCDRYYPLEKPEEYGYYKVSVKEKKDSPFSGIKYQVLEVTGGSGPMVVHHFIYDAWTDHTAPESAAPAIGLFKMAKKLAGGAPITVHCSAGIGRAATFIGIDYASQKIRVEENFSMVSVIKHLRTQRLHSIQSAIQYVFLHVCLLELFADEGILPRQGLYERFVDKYQKLLKRFEKYNANLKK